MAKVGFSAAAFADFERIFDHYAEVDLALAKRHVRVIREAVAILANHPLIGRPTKHGLRELVISRGKTGFLALYRFYPKSDRVMILRIRHQRELGYPRRS